MTRRARLLLTDDPDPWYRDGVALALAAIAGALRAAGWDADLVGPGEAAGDDLPPLVAGPGPGSITRTLRDGYRLAHRLARDPPDLVLAPLRRGIAQPLLMRRATGEAFGATRVAVLAGPPTACRLRLEDAAIADPGALVDDALERSVLRLADRVLATSPAALDRLRALIPEAAAVPAPPPLAALPPADPPGALAPEAIREIVLVGPGSRRAGLPACLDAVERLDRAGRLAGRSLTLLGPMREAAPGLSKSLIGLRALDWRFPFRVEDAPTLGAAWDYLRRPGLLPVFAGEAGDDDPVLAAALAAGMPVLVAASHPLADRVEPANLLVSPAGDSPADALAAGLARALAHGLPPSRPLPDGAGAWAAALNGLVAAAPRAIPAAAPAAGRPGVSVCLTHRDRPAALAAAVGSIAAERAADEVVVVENASTVAEPTEAAERAAAAAGLRFRRLDMAEAVPQALACNRAAAAARGELVIFLDDDNALAPGGIERFRRAFASHPFDVVVSALDLYDGGVRAGPADARLLFLGDPGSAGLFFNGFGDTAMAVRREAFLRIGGFETGDHAGPALDWIFLAKARARGLGIGVLQEPAVRYARNLADVDLKWRKRDQEGARAAVLAAYGGAFDPWLVARLAQGATLDLF